MRSFTRPSRRSVGPSKPIRPPMPTRDARAPIALWPLWMPAPPSCCAIGRIVDTPLLRAGGRADRDEQRFGAVSPLHHEVDGHMRHDRHLLLLNGLGVRRRLERDMALRLFAGQQRLARFVVDAHARRHAAAVNRAEMLIDRVKRHVALEAGIALNRYLNSLRFTGFERDRSRTNFDGFEIERFAH